MSSNGFFSLAVSNDSTPNQGNLLYKMRDNSEILFSIIKSQEGGETVGVHKTEGIYSKFAMLFITSLIRFEIETACKKLDLETNPMILKMNSVIIMNTSNDKYEAIRNLTNETKLLLSEFDIDFNSLELLTNSFNDRKRTDCKNPIRNLPSDEISIVHSNSHKRGKNSITKIENNSSSNNVNINVTEKSKGGRPKGKKDQKPRKQRSDKGKLRGSYGKN